MNDTAEVATTSISGGTAFWIALVTIRHDQPEPVANDDYRRLRSPAAAAMATKPANPSANPRIDARPYMSLSFPCKAVITRGRSAELADDPRQRGADYVLGRTSERG